MTKWDSSQGCKDGAIFASQDIIHHINKTKDKNHMIISIDAGKTFDKIQHPFMIKTLRKVGIEGGSLNIIKAMYERPTPNIILNGKTLSFPTKIQNKTRMSTFTTPIQQSNESPSHRDQTRKRINGIQIGKEEAKLSLFAEDMIVYIENPIVSTKKYST